MTGVAGIGASLAEAPKARESAGNPAEILVGVDEGKGDVQAVVDQHLPAVASKLGTNAHVVKTNDVLSYATIELADADPATQQAAIDTLSERSDIRYAEKNGTYRALYTPNDPEFSNQYAPQMVNAPEAWNTTLGDSDVTIAIVDTGIKYDHPDLADNMSNLDSNHGHDFVDNDDDPYPADLNDEYHGTHVAGIAAAVTDNSEGIAGISNSSILSVRVLNENGWGSWDDIADGIQYAADQGADVINLSLGGTTDSATMKNAVSYAHSHGVLLVASAGNSYRSTSGYPAAYEECISVSSLTEGGDLSSFSNVGKEVELAAPGSSVLSTWTNDGYHSISGTSMAAPVVAGVAALVISEHGIRGEELRRHLRETASDIGLTAGEQGYGMVDANQAVSTAPQENYHAHLGDTWSGNSPSNHGLRVDAGNTRYGLFGTTSADNGWALLGRATSSSGSTIGAFGRSDSSEGSGVYGIASADSGDTYGVRGRADSPTGDGVYGLATSPTGVAVGVRGQSHSPQGFGLWGVGRDGADGLYGRAYGGGPDGNATGVLARSDAPEGRGVVGFTTSSSGSNTGVYGRSESSEGIGVRGWAMSSSGETVGVLGETDSPDGYGMYSDGDMHVDGDFSASGTKNFVQTVTTDDGPKEVAYTAVEADRARTETAGVAELENGRAEIDLPDHFGLVTSEAEDLVIQLTPYGGSTGLKVVERSLDQIVIEDLDGDGEYEFAYTVQGTRAGYEDTEVVRDVARTVSPDGPTMPDYTEK